MEEWRPVVGKEGLYEVSDQGRVRSLDRIVVRRVGKPFLRKSRILKGNDSVNGYRTVNLGKTTYIHQLVLEAFYGPRPAGLEACHRNGVRSDNRADNLRWGSPSSNQMDRAMHGTSNRGERCGTAKLTDEQAREIIQSTDRGCDLARRYGVAQQTICAIRKRRKWQHV
jgi:hypothetical protein